MPDLRSAWIAVASADHVRRGLQGGFMQVCHGKAAPLRRMKPGDGVVYYSPVATLGDKAPCRRFTAIGLVAERGPYAFDMGGGFVPFRRDVHWAPSRDAPIAPLLPLLDLFRGEKNWGRKLRFGLVAVKPADFATVVDAMGATLPAF